MSKMKIALLLSVGLVGCAETADVTIHHPLIQGALDTNKIVKERGGAERQNGLPMGSLANEVSLTSASESQVCFKVALHSLEPIDVRHLKFKLSTPKNDDGTESARVTGDAKVAAHDGLVAHRQQTGVETYCSQRDSYNNCVSWQTRPIYAVTWDPGVVRVYSSNGTVCFGNSGVVNTSTALISLDIDDPSTSANRAMASIFSFGIGADANTYRWGFTGAQKASK